MDPGTHHLSFWEKMMKPFNQIFDHRGTVLIIALLVISTLTGLTIDFSEETGIELNLAGFSRDNAMAWETARSGVHMALYLLDRDEERSMDSLLEDWARLGPETLPAVLGEDASLEGRITDECGKLNINNLFNSEGQIDEEMMDRFKRLFSILGMEEDLLEPLFDWLDKDDTPRVNGAESAFYRDLLPSYTCSNGAFLTVGQIALVKGLKDSGLSRYVTVYTDGKVNLNTAPKEVLESLSPKLDSSMAEAIIEYRKDKDFLNADELSQVPGMDQSVYSGVSQSVTVKSAAFSIEVEGKYRETLTKISAVALRIEGRPQLVYWKVH